MALNIELAKELISDESLKTELAQGLKDRIVLAHGVSVDQNGKKFLMSKKGLHPLTSDELNSMIERGRGLGTKIIQEIQKRNKLVSPPNEDKK